MEPGQALATGATCVWLGMVGAISFMEAPLKFRAPGITRALGVGIGRLVFGALNIAEGVLTVVLVAGLLLWRPSAAVVVAAVVPPACLLVQLLVVRPALRARSNRLLRGDIQASAGAPRAPIHHAYVAVELLKAMALVASMVTLFST